MGTDNGLDVYFQGDGGLRPRRLISTPVPIHQIETADMNLDGLQDVVVNTPKGIVVLTNTGHGLLKGATITTREQSDIQIGDVSNDGRPDVVGCDGAGRCTGAPAHVLNAFIQDSNGAFTQDTYAGTNQSTTPGAAVGIGDVTATD